ncbi:MAG: glutamate--tRNA ligase [Gammaproteobacteria bacterium]|nr:glutamate--tRNA ligase [Gammaproteobacteria bacterium]
MTVRTRFAPSPTGYLHIGSARTALYAWLYARKCAGKFILRIEDTDTERSTQEAVEAIFEAMHWLGLEHDEGPFFQMQHLSRYHEVAEKLIQEGKAYRCDCTKERLETMREAQIAKKEKPRYDGHCRERHLPPTTHPHVIRFKSPTKGEVCVEDCVRGAVIFKNEELDDLVLVRSDGVPTYNFSVVIDDHDMQVTHVIRGDDHLNNTPRQINLYHALHFSVPIFAHIPMILGADGKRLSKRHGAVNVMNYREAGYLPHALLNYLVRLGWSHGDQEVFSMDEMIQLFDLGHISRSPASFNPSKLLWLNHHYIKALPAADLVGELAYHMKKENIDITNGPSLEDVIVQQRERYKTLHDMAQGSAFFYQEPQVPAELIEKFFTPENTSAVIEFRDKLNQLETWDEATLHQCLNEVVTQLNIKLGQLAQPIRVALTGGTVSPALNHTLSLLGREKSIKRINRVIN